MKLVYRGKSYDSNAVPVDMAETEATGQYRGQTVHFTYPRHIPVPQPVHALKYRGIAYQTTVGGSREAIAAAVQPRATVEQLQPVTFAQAVAPKSRQAMLAEVARVHRHNVQRSLQHRLDVARERGDQALINILEREMQQIV